MMHQQPEGPPIPLQVELNTISSAFACLSSNVAQMHRYVSCLKLYEGRTLIASL
jgi:hypothetical protein